MKRLLVLLLIIILTYACDEGFEVTDLGEGDDLTIQDQKDAPGLGGEEACPETCNDNDVCTEDTCSNETGYKCVFTVLEPCCGNSNCEEGEAEVGCSDCPECPEPGLCQEVGFDYEYDVCTIKDVEPCCGNNKCETSETYDDCEEDCPKCETDEECLKAVFDYDEQECVERPEVPCCGNGICDVGENPGMGDMNDGPVCTKDCGEAFEVENFDTFPSFLDIGTLLVVGDKGTSQDSLTGVEFALHIQTIKGIDVESNVYSGFSETDLESKDVIMIGNPCQNQFWQDFLYIECDEDYFEKDRAFMKVIDEEDRQILLVAGHTSDDTKKAADYLMGHSWRPDTVIVEIHFDTSGEEATKI